MLLGHSYVQRLSSYMERHHRSLGELGLHANVTVVAQGGATVERVNQELRWNHSVDYADVVYLHPPPRRKRLWNTAGARDCACHCFTGNVHVAAKRRRLRGDSRTDTIPSSSDQLVLPREQMSAKTCRRRL